MQNATFAITISHFSSHIYLHSLQKQNHTSITSLILRFTVYETLQINQSNFLTFKNYPYDKGKLLSKAGITLLSSTMGQFRGTKLFYFTAGIIE